MDKLEYIQELLSAAYQSDLESGVAWLNDIEPRIFAEKYPEISKAITTIMEMEDDGQQKHINKAGTCPSQVGCE